MIKNLITIFSTFTDVALPWQFHFQVPVTPTMEGITKFHDDLMVCLIFVVVIITWLVGKALWGFSELNSGPKLSNKKFVHGTAIEIAWTLLPAFILLLLAVPSCALLYSMDEIVETYLTIKVVGHQWFWSYEYSDTLYFGNLDIRFDSSMVEIMDLEKGQNRLLEVDWALIVPSNVHIRFLVTSSDVLHSWAVPALGIKVDACPGRLNQVSTFIKQTGTFYGQCSEICGLNHGFMPIVVEVVPYSEFCKWVTEKSLTE